jgi:hypothetical protein
LFCPSGFLAFDDVVVKSLCALIVHAPLKDSKFQNMSSAFGLVGVFCNAVPHWQVESEEFQMEYDNSFDDSEQGDESEDSPFAKKRRSWKQHRVDAGEGRYACDQCDKLFSKQSSLARHKYEHSG